jgi:hypothetical protein
VTWIRISNIPRENRSRSNQLDYLDVIYLLLGILDKYHLRQYNNTIPTPTPGDIAARYNSNFELYTAGSGSTSI